jgi:hypothetical protein
MTFLVKDLMINIAAAGGGGGNFLPADDGVIPTPLTPHTPVISVAVVTAEFRQISPVLKEGLKQGDAIARAADGDPDGSPAVKAVLGRLNRVAVGAAAVAYGGGGVGMPDPNCGGSSLETIPTPITPYVREAKSVISRSQLPAIRKHLEQVLIAVEKAEAELAPHGREADIVRSHLEGALSQLKNVKTDGVRGGIDPVMSESLRTAKA